MLTLDLFVYMENQEKNVKRNKFARAAKYHEYGIFLVRAR